MSIHCFYLYVAGSGDLSRAARANFERLIRPALESLDGDDDVALEVIDVMEEATAAHRDKVVATPMLVRASPEPTVRVLGTLNEPSRVLSMLGVDGPDGESDLPRATADEFDSSMMLRG